MKYKDFDNDKFYKDVKAFFIKNNLIQPDIEEIRKNIIHKIEQISDQKLIIQLEDYLKNNLAKTS